MASAALQAASVSAGSGSPVASMAHPPKGNSAKLELVAEFRGAFLQHAHGGPHDFRADAVARQEDNFLILNGHGFVAGRRQILLRSPAVRAK